MTAHKAAKHHTDSKDANKLVTYIPLGSIEKS